MKYMIGIPSRGRGVTLPDSWLLKQMKNQRANMKVFVREVEKEDYIRNLDLNNFWCTVPNDVDIAQKRKLILQVAHAEGCKYLFLSDDDIKLDIRRADDRKKFRSMTPEELDTFLEKAMKICSRKYPIVHPVLRMHADKRKYTYEKNCPAIRFVCYHVPTFMEEGVALDGLGTSFMSDRYAQLFLLDRGYRSIAMAEYCVDDKGTNMKGGCSDYRTAKLQSLAAKKLHDRFPNNVALKVKNDGKWNVERLDCTIQWKKFIPKAELNYIPKKEMER